jgi:hypothetical protein
MTATNGMPKRQSLLILLVSLLLTAFSASAITRPAMQLPNSLPTKIRNVWAKNSEIARNCGESLTPKQFVEMFVDQNLIKTP